MVLTGIQSGLIPMTMGERTDEWTRKVPTPNPLSNTPLQVWRTSWEIKMKKMDGKVETLVK